jgi:Protein of unknown function (DUF998)
LRIEDLKVTRPATQKALLASGFGGLAFFAAFMVLGAVAPHYNSARDTISALEFTPWGWVQQLNFMVFGFVLGVFAAALRNELRGGRGSVSIPLFQLLSGIGVLGAGIFVNEPLHLISDLVAFNSALIVLFLFAWRFSGDRRWKGWTAYSIAAGLLMMALLTAFGMALHFGGSAGAFEKLASLTRTLWSAALVKRLYAGGSLAPADI